MFQMVFDSSPTYLTWEKAIFTDFLDFFWFGVSALWRRWQEARGWRRLKFQRFGVLNARMEVSSGSVTTRKLKKVFNNNLHQLIFSFYYFIRYFLLPIVCEKYKIWWSSQLDALFSEYITQIPKSFGKWNRAEHSNFRAFKEIVGYPIINCCIHGLQEVSKSLSSRVCRQRWIFSGSWN